MSAPRSSASRRLVLEAFRHVAVDDAERQAFDDRGLADAGLADQHRVVLGAARQHLDGAADFLVAADDRVELAVARRLGEVAGVFLQRVVLAFRRRGVGGAALADFLDRRVQRLRGDAGILQDLGRAGVLLHGEREQQPLDGDERVAGLLGDLLGRVENLGRRRRKVKLARAAAKLSAARQAPARSPQAPRAALPPARSISPAASPSVSSRSTFRMCSGVNCWWPAASAPV